MIGGRAERIEKFIELTASTAKLVPESAPLNSIRPASRRLFMCSLFEQRFILQASSQRVLTALGIICEEFIPFKNMGL